MLVADARAHRRLEAGLDQQLRQLRCALAAAAVRLAQGEAVAIGVMDHARLDHVGGRIDDAAEHRDGRQRGRQRPSGSTTRMRLPSNAGPPSLYVYHQGTPFIAATMVVFGPISGLPAVPSPAAGNAPSG
jgi:hypothetical protein